MKLFKNLTKEENAWVLYDVGNSAFTMLSCSLIPIYFKAIAIGEGVGKISSDKATAMWALTISIVTVIVAVLGPIFGAISDHKGKKKIIFNTVVAMGVIGCILNGFVNSWLFFLILFALTKVVYSISLTVYDSMLGDITSEERMDEVSSYGYAWGYIGSCIPFIIALIAYVLGGGIEGFQLIPASLGKIIGFSVTGIWWLIVTLPLIKNYEQKNYSTVNKHEIKMIFSHIGNTIKKIVKSDKKVFMFLIAFFLYIDGVGTIIDNCINVGTDLGLNTVGQVIFLLATQVVAFIFSLIFAKLSKKFRTVTLILVCIVGYFIVCLYALTLHNLLGFGILAFMIGMFQGSIQSLSRSYFTKIIPAEHSGEYFGIYDIFAKGASFFGSAVIAAVKFAGGTINIAVASLAFFFFFGFIFLVIADRTPKLEED